SPRAFSQLMIAVEFLVGNSVEVVIAGDRAADDTKAMMAALNASFLPNAVVVMRPHEEKAASAIVELAPYTELQSPVDGRATAYVCQNFACKSPTTDVAEMLVYLGVGADSAPASDGAGAEPGSSN